LEATNSKIKECLYKNSLAASSLPLSIEMAWGRRNVDNYIKKKKLRYIVIERESGNRHTTNSPTHAVIKKFNKFIGEKVTGPTTIDADIKWYDSSGEEIAATSSTAPPANAKYGLIKIPDTPVFSSAFYTRFVSTRGKNEPYSYTIWQNNQTIGLRPIFKMAYFFGESCDGKYVSTDPDLS
jgi:hypothetical protein